MKLNSKDRTNANHLLSTRQELPFLNILLFVAGILGIYGLIANSV